MFERFKNRKPYAYFDPSVLRDHCEYGLLPAHQMVACYIPGRESTSS